MPLVPFGDLLGEAARGGYAVGYFEAWDSYSLEAVLASAELERSPVVLGFGCLLLDQSWLANGGIEIFGSLGRAAAERHDPRGRRFHARDLWRSLRRDRILRESGACRTAATERDAAGRPS